MFCTQEELQCPEKKCRYCKFVASFPCKDQTREKFSKLAQIGNEILKDKFHSQLKVKCKKNIIQNLIQNNKIPLIT